MNVNQCQLERGNQNPILEIERKLHFCVLQDSSSILYNRNNFRFTIGVPTTIIVSFFVKNVCSKLFSDK